METYAWGFTFSSKFKRKDDIPFKKLNEDMFGYSYNTWIVWD